MNGTVQYIVQGTALRDNPKYIKYYIFWSKFIIVELIPYVTILLLNSKIIHKIYKSHTFRKRFLVREMGFFSTFSISVRPCGYLVLYSSPFYPKRY